MTSYTSSRGALLLDFDARTLNQLQRDIRAVDVETSNALRRELREGANVLRDGLQEAAKSSTLGDMNTKGGRNEGAAAAAGIANRVSRSKVGVQWKPKGGARGFTQRAPSNRGYIRHPVYGNRKAWAWTYRPSLRGWWDEAEDKHIEKAGQMVIAALDKALRTLAGFTS